MLKSIFIPAFLYKLERLSGLPFGYSYFFDAAFFRGLRRRFVSAGSRSRRRSSTAFQIRLASASSFRPPAAFVRLPVRGADRVPDRSGGTRSSGRLSTSCQSFRRRLNHENYVRQNDRCHEMIIDSRTSTFLL